MGTLFVVAVLKREVFEAIEFDAACSGDHRSAAEQMSRLADMGIQTGEMARSEAYVRAGEQWLAADEPAAAANRFQRALEDGGPTSVDPRAPLARALFMLGRDDEAETLVSRLSQERPRDARMCDLLAELFVDRSDLPRALAWATAGVDVCLGRVPAPVAPGTPTAAMAEAGGGPQPNPGSIPRALRDRVELRLLLTLRFRIRNDLGLPEDDYDRLLDQLPPEFADPASAG